MKSNVIAHAHIKRKAILGIMLALLLVSMLTTAFNLLPVKGQTPLWTYPTGSTNIRDVMVSADGSLVVTGTADGNIHGIKNGFVQWKYLTGDWILSADMSDDGGRVAAGSDDGNFYVLDGNTGTLLFKYFIGSRFSGVDVTPNGQYFAAGCHNDNVYFFSVAGPLWTKTLGNYACGVSISNDGGYVAAGSVDNNAYFFDGDGNLLWSYLTGGTVWEVHTSVDGTYVAFGSEDKYVHLLDRSGNVLWTYETENQVKPVRISTDKNYVAAGIGVYIGSGTDYYYIYLFNTNGDLLWKYPALDTIHDVAISPDSTYVVACGDDNNIYLLTIDGDLIWKHDAGARAFSVAISSDGNYIAAGSSSEVFLFNAPPAPVQLTIEVVGSGSTDPAPGTYTYDEGSVVSVEPQPDDGWRLDHWLLDGVDVGSDDPYEVTMDDDHTLTAVFVEIPPTQHELTIEVEGSGTTSPAPGVHMYNEGSVVPVEPQPDDGWRLDHWLLDGVDVGSDDPYEVTMDAPHTLRAVFVEGPSPPEASFTYSPSAPKKGETVSFDARNSDDPDGNIVDWDWDFGDTSSGSGETVTHEYEVAGSYTVTLTVTDNDGQTDTYDRTITVVPDGQNGGDVTNPVADAGNDETVKAGATVTFNGGGSSDNVGVSSYEWDFGDGTTDTGVVATHTYTKEGTYTVTLTVKDGAGNSDTDTLRVTVDEAAAPFPLWVLVPVMGGVGGGAAVLVYLKRRKPKEEVPRPSSVRVTAEPTELPADGKSRSTVTLELLDKEGKLMPAPEDIEVKLSSTLGKVKSPVVVSKGKAEEKAFLISSKEFGTVRVSADAKGLKSIGVTLSFLEKKRYCMCCGARISLEDKRCPECNEPPPSAPDTFKCKNCGELLPSSVKTLFCRECGASQPK